MSAPWQYPASTSTSTSSASCGLCPATVVVVAATEENLELLDRLAAGSVLAPRWPTVFRRTAGPDRPAAPPAPSTAVDAVGSLAVDVAAHVVAWRGRKLPLTEQEFALLARLLRPMGKAHTFGELGREVWRISEHFDTTLIHSAMRRLRHKLAAAGVDVTIESVRGYGFRLVGPEPAPEPASEPETDSVRRP